MLTRDFSIADVPAIDSIYNKQDTFGLPSLKNTLISVTVEDNKKIIGYGTLKLFAEASMLLDKDISKREKAKAFKDLIRVAILRSTEMGIEQLYLISNSKDFSTILCNKYLFKRVPGELLMLDLTTEEQVDGK